MLARDVVAGSTAVTWQASVLSACAATLLVHVVVTALRTTDEYSDNL